MTAADLTAGYESTVWFTAWFSSLRSKWIRCNIWNRNFVSPQSVSTSAAVDQKLSPEDMACPCHHTIFQKVSPASTGTYLEPFQRFTYQLIVFGWVKHFQSGKQSHFFLSVFVLEDDVFNYFFFLSVWIYIPVGDLWVGCSSYNFNVIDYSVS